MGSERSVEVRWGVKGVWGGGVVNQRYSFAVDDIYIILLPFKKKIIPLGLVINVC